MVGTSQTPTRLLENITTFVTGFRTTQRQSHTLNIAIHPYEGLINDSACSILDSCVGITFNTDIDVTTSTSASRDDFLHTFIMLCRAIERIDYIHFHLSVEVLANSSLHIVDKYRTVASRLSVMRLFLSWNVCCTYLESH